MGGGHGKGSDLEEDSKRGLTVRRVIFILIGKECELGWERCRRV